MPRNYQMKWEPPSFATLTGVVVFEGDSLTSGYDSDTFTDNISALRASTYFAAANPSCSVYNVAVGGESASQMIAQAASQVDVRYNAARQFNAAILWAGTNDMVNQGHTPAAAYADVATWCNARRGAGWKVVCCNCIRRSDLNETNRGTFNGLLASDHSFADSFVDLAALLDYWDTKPAYWQGDHIHITAAAASLIATTVETAIRSVI